MVVDGGDIGAVGVSFELVVVWSSLVNGLSFATGLFTSSPATTAAQHRRDPGQAWKLPRFHSKKLGPLSVERPSQSQGLS